MRTTEDKELIISNYKTHVECGWYNDGRNLYQIAKKEAICFLSDKEIERLAKLNTIVYSDVWDNNAVVGKPTVKLINEIKTILKETMQND